jgi:Zn-dependent M28 family amino/carboxypeptidase
MTYYGRWTYKYEEAARQGAAGAIIVHETKAAGYGWDVVSGSWSGAQYMLFTEDGNKGNVAVEGWISQPAAETLFEKSGLNYQEMVAKAGAQGFAPVAMPAAVSTALEIASKRSTSYNVGGVLPGRTRPDELFLYTGHWDHLGIKPVDGDEDVIFNGAQDNATGTAALLEMAQAFNALPQPPERSVLFLIVTAEESGLLGSQQYAADPAFPMAKTVAGINIDAMSTYGATDDIVVVGYGNSEMDVYLKAVSDTQGRVLVQEPTPEKGFFYRSDHFNMAKKGVPMLYAEAGEQVRGKPEGYGKAESERYGAERYHKPADEVHAEWDNGGIMQDLNAHFRIGVTISDSNDWPQWAQGNEFKAIREASQK